MRKFSEGYLDANYAAAAAQIPWGHNMLLLDKVEDPAKRLWYAQQSLKHSLVFRWFAGKVRKTSKVRMYGCFVIQKHLSNTGVYSYLVFRM